MLGQDAFVERPSHAQRVRGERVVGVSDLDFRWRKEGPAVLAIDALDIWRGQRVFIEGPSGSGKSTLLSLLAGVVTPRRDDVTVLGTARESTG